MRGQVMAGRKNGTDWQASLLILLFAILAIVALALIFQWSYTTFTPTTDDGTPVVVETGP